MADDPTVLQILMGMKEDLGEIRANSVSMKQNLETHINDDRLVAARVTVLEMRVEREKGFFKAWQFGAAVAGAAITYAIQFLVSWLKSKPT